MADIFLGDPGTSSIRIAGQSMYTRPATDVYLCGHACALQESPVTQMTVNVQVGPCSSRLLVSGDRVWRRSVTLGAAPSDPEPFVRMPIVWERAYGGTAASSQPARPEFDARNPLGCGRESNPGDAIGKPVPNIEDPQQPLRGLTDRPRPVGLGPLGRHWQPRVQFAGTYDDAWQRTRAPLWPADFDEQFFCAAPSDLQARPHLQGGEPVLLDGMHPGGPIRFNLPQLKFTSVSYFIDRTVRTQPRLDGIFVDADALRLTMFFRSAIEAPLELVRHRATLLRMPEPWEAGGVT